MKKKLLGRKSIILAGILVLSFTILFSSCSSQKSVVKRSRQVPLLITSQGKCFVR